jgi:hypothetical protein
MIDARRAPLPTRCLEVSADGFRLKETSSETGPYIALSHRWTPETELGSTTTANVALRLQENGDKWQESLPATFLDAMTLARQLGIQYVWIDSLCIIRTGDGGHDWRNEAVKMADYYQ